MSPERRCQSRFTAVRDALDAEEVKFLHRLTQRNVQLRVVFAIRTQGALQPNLRVLQLAVEEDDRPIGFRPVLQSVVDWNEAQGVLRTQRQTTAVQLEAALHRH